MIILIEKLITEIARIQNFIPDDRYSRMIDEMCSDELLEDDLDFVFAARKDDTNYTDFVNKLNDVTKK